MTHDVLSGTLNPTTPYQKNALKWLIYLAEPSLESWWLFWLDEWHRRCPSTMMVEALADRRQWRRAYAADRQSLVAETLAVDSRCVEDKTAACQVRRRVDRWADGCSCHGVGPDNLGVRGTAACPADGQIKYVPRIRRRRCRRRWRRDQLGRRRHRRIASVTCRLSWRTVCLPLYLTAVFTRLADTADRVGHRFAYLNRNWYGKWQR